MDTVECSELYVLSYIGHSGPSVRSYPCVQLQVEQSHESMYGDNFYNHYNIVWPKFSAFLLGGKLVWRELPTKFKPPKPARK